MKKFSKTIVAFILSIGFVCSTFSTVPANEIEKIDENLSTIETPSVADEFEMVIPDGKELEIEVDAVPENEIEKSDENLSTTETPSVADEFEMVIPDGKEIEISRENLSNMKILSVADEFEVVIPDGKELTIEIDEEELNIVSQKARSNKNIDNSSITYDNTKPFIALENAKSFSSFGDIASFYSNKATTSNEYSTFSIANSSPNDAIPLPPAYFGLDLTDRADQYDGWYFFEGLANTKYTIRLSMPGGCDYDAYLYKLVGSTLNLVDYSFNTGSSNELISHYTDGSLYFIRFVPYIVPTTPTTYTFSVFESKNFDLFEPNDTSSAARNCFNSINLSTANLDNPYDEDWYKFNVTTPGTRDIGLFNTPAGNHYALFIYDSSLNAIASFYADNLVRYLDFEAGTYYVRIKTLSGVISNNNYWLNVTDADHHMRVYNGNVYFIKPGEKFYECDGIGYVIQSDEYFFYDYLQKKPCIISLKSNGVTINGNFINMANKKYFYGQTGDYLFTEGVITTTLGSPLINDVIYGKFRTAIGVNIVGYMAEPSSYSPTGYFYFNTYDSQVYPGNSLRVSRITAFIDVNTFEVFHAER